jgi:sortase A
MSEDTMSNHEADDLPAGDGTEPGRSADAPVATQDRPDAAVVTRRPPSTTGDKVRFVLRGVGQTLITGGLVVLLFVVYEVYVTNFFAHRDQVRVHDKLEQEWAGGQDPLALPGINQSGIPLGAGIANLYIPRFGKDFAFTIVQGTDESSLEKGPGHYDGTALPGGVGNFAVAGHRVGKGEPFLNLDHLQPGDDVIVETKTDWYVYVVEGDVRTGDLSVRDANNVPGREIVDPSDTEVIDPIPDSPGRVPSPADHYMTMTTCHPKFTATQRMIVHAQLDPSLTVPHTAATMPAAISALYDKAGL